MKLGAKYKMSNTIYINLYNFYRMIRVVIDRCLTSIGSTPLSLHVTIVAKLCKFTCSSHFSLKDLIKKGMTVKGNHVEYDKCNIIQRVVLP